MAKKALFIQLLSYLIVFILCGGFFHVNLLANNVSSMERESLKKCLLPTEDLREAIVAYSNARLANIEKIDNFLANEYVEKQLAKWGYSANKVRTAVRTLTGSELEYLARQSENASRNIYGGAIKGETIGYMLIGLTVTAVILWEVLGWWCVPNWVPLSL
jgi:hypothetical protein